MSAMVRPQLSGETFVVVGLYQESIWVRYCALKNDARPSDDCRNPGLSVELLHLMSKTLGFDFRMFWVSSYDDLEDAIENGTADFSLNFLAGSPERWERFHYLKALNYFSVGFVTKTPVGLTSKMPMLRPFELPVWMALLSSIVLMSISFSMLDGFPLSIRDTLFKVFGAILGQKDVSLAGQMSVRWNPFKEAAYRILSFHLAIFLLLVQSTYGGLLLAFLYPDDVNIPFRDSGELSGYLASGIKRFYLRKLDSWYFTIINESEANGHVLMRRALEDAKLLFHNGKPDEVMPALLADPDLVYATTSTTYAILTHHYCGVSYVKDESMAMIWESVVMRKNFSYASLFQKQALMVQPVFRQIANRDYYKEGAYATTDEEKCLWGLDDQQSIDFLAFSSTILLWGVGTVISAVVFLIELILFRRQSKLWRK